MTTYTTADLAALLGVSERRVRALARAYGVGVRTLDGWRFTPDDLANLRRQPRVRDFLTLSPGEARLIAQALSGHLRTEGMAAREELLTSILDSVGPDCEGDRLDELHGVANWRALVARIAALSEPQAGLVLAAVAAFWAGDLTLPTDDLLATAGLL